MEVIKNFLMEVVQHLSEFGHLGIFIGMALESACIPIPSEIILPLAGYMVYLEKGTIYSMTAISTLGCLVGSLLAYVIGYYGGRPFIKKYGKYFFMSNKDFMKADRFFKNHGGITIFTSRMLPIVRTFISLPAGIAGMNIFSFIILTILGSFPWCLLFVYLGQKFGKDWNKVEGLFSNFNYLVIGVLLLLIITFIVKKLNSKSQYIFTKSRYQIFREFWLGYLKNDKIGVAFLTFFIILVSLLSVFIKFTKVFMGKSIFGIDLYIIKYMESMRSNHLTYIFKLITASGNFIPIIVITIITCILVLRKSTLQSLYFAINIMGVWGFNEILKYIFKRQRPLGIHLVNVTGYSFPSGHAMISITFGISAIYFILTYLKHRKTAWLTSIFIFMYALLIGISRAYLGVHYMTDIIAGWLLGTLWAVMFILINRIFLYKQKLI